MSNRICPVCGTGSCKFRDGIMCRSWVCSEGIYKQNKGNGKVDNPLDEIQNIMDFFNNACKGGFRS